MGNDKLFHVIEDTQVVMRTKGVYRQTKAYRRDKHIYAGWGSGFVRLLASGGTSHPNVTWDHLEPHSQIVRDGRILEYRP